MKAKYDRPALKLEFINSDIDEVQEFLRWKFGEKLARSNMKNKCKGWSKEKQELKNRILEKALERKAKEEANNLEIPITQLKQAKKTVIWLVMRKLKEAIDWGDITVKEQEKILKMIKTELWEPTNISKTDATIKTNPLDESLFIQD